MVTVDRSDRLDAKIADLVGRDQEVTLTAIGGVDTVPASWAGNALFPYVADAAVAEWGMLSDSQHEHRVCPLRSPRSPTRAAPWPSTTHARPLCPLLLTSGSRSE